ncbi:MAG: hypothetical protein GY941_21550 [Planctomycetes bacterium]|nr:hypothetical protein [Planctomycetota bacterium]
MGMTNKELEKLMGRRVHVVKQFVRVCWEDGRKEWKEDAVDLTGWIVGHRTKQNGCTEFPLNRMANFVPDKWTPCLMVATSPRTVPIYVPYDGYVLKEDKTSIMKQRIVDAVVDLMASIE